jgi:hypothetical protein
VAVRLVFPTPPAREKIASTGTLAAEEFVALSGIAADAAEPSKTPFNANQREVMRSREPWSVSSRG